MNKLLSDAQFLDLYNCLTGEEKLGPDPGQGSVTCDYTLCHTIDWMKEHQIQNIPGNIEKIIDLGGHCDCEVLLNVDPDTWEERREEEIMGPDHLGERDWKQFVAELLASSGYY